MNMKRSTLIFSKFGTLVSLFIFCFPGVKNSLFAQSNRYKVITTFAGNGTSTLTAQGQKTIDADAAGNLYLADAANQRIRKIIPLALPVELLSFIVKNRGLRRMNIREV